MTEVTYDAETGLCRSCAYVREVVSAKGGVFFMCKHPQRPKYPALPVMKCDGYLAEQQAHIEVPYKDLSPAALDGVIEELVTREGTEYGRQEVTLEAKKSAVRKQLERGDAVLLFDALTGTTNIVTKRDHER